MLGQLQMSYLQYMFLAAAACAANCLSAGFGPIGRPLGRASALDEWSDCPLPAMWLISDNLVYLFVLQVYSGVIWAGFDLAMLLLFFETISARSGSRF